eukprot:scaffold2974_cov404-Prasinococcus_capsulatus_cf.AAC.1
MSPSSEYPHAVNPTSLGGLALLGSCSPYLGCSRTTWSPLRTPNLSDSAATCSGPSATACLGS